MLAAGRLSFGCSAEVRSSHAVFWSPQALFKSITRCYGLTVISSNKKALHHEWITSPPGCSSSFLLRQQWEAIKRKIHFYQFDRIVLIFFFFALLNGSTPEYKFCFGFMTMTMYLWLKVASEEKISKAENVPSDCLNLRGLMSCWSSSLLKAMLKGKYLWKQSAKKS